MKIFRSIKWRLQLWYGLILVIVLTGFGFTAYQLERGRAFGRIDDELQRRVEVLAGTLRRPPHGPGSNHLRGDRPPSEQNFGETPFANPPPDQNQDDEPSGQRLHSPLMFNLPPQATHLFDTNDPNNFYFVINNRNGNEIARSTNVPPGEIFFQSGLLVQLNPHPEKPPDDNLGKVNKLIPSPTQRMVGQEVVREIRRNLPSGETIVVGCSVTNELKELRLTALRLAGIGGVILFFGLAGGWWFVLHALRPIENISSAAVKISAGDLSQRINVAEAESELGQLAAVLNSTFARLQTAFVQQQQFTSDAAHELRTPVSVMLTQAQTALNRERTAPEYRETVETCQRAAQRMRRLIESLLALARLDAGQEPMKRLDFDLANTVRDCVELVRPLADERNVKIVSDLPPLKCVGDSERLAQVITNLLTNAIQYNLPDGEVRIAAKSQNGMILLTVNDTGKGIAVEDLPRVFERFYRADKSRSTGGNGLGLAISRSVVEAHGGTIEVTSKENVGTTFSVRLPI
jgi:two-component system OmpR family sensor kinase